MGVILLVSSTVRAQKPEPPFRAQVQQELDEELRELVNMPAPELDIRYEGLGSDAFEVVESQVALDGRPLEGKFPKGASHRTPAILFSGEASPGEHLLTLNLVLKQTRGSTFFTSVEGLRFKVPGRVTLHAQPGLVLRVRLALKADALATDLKKRLVFDVKVQPEMVATLDDGSTPEPPPGPTLPAKPPAPSRRKRGAKKAFTAMNTGRWKVKRQPLSEGPSVSRRALEGALEKARQANRVETVTDAAP